MKTYVLQATYLQQWRPPWIRDDKNKFKIGDLRDIQLRGIKAVANGKDAV